VTLGRQELKILMREAMLKVLGESALRYSD
jgi:hypothetical protein